MGKGVGLIVCGGIQPISGNLEIFMLKRHKVQSSSSGSKCLNLPNCGNYAVLETE